MTSYRTLESVRVARTQEVSFAGDGVLLAGQIDYPDITPPMNGFPLIFILHHAGCNARESYQHYADIGIASGYAVFRWDKRGTGRSGASGRGSTTQDAVNAYETALEQPRVNHKRVVVIAQEAGSALLGSSYGLFARIQQPYGVSLVSNMLDAETVLAIGTRLQVIVGQKDWHPWQEYAREVCEAHNAAYKYGASYYVAPYGDRALRDIRDQGDSFHTGAANALRDWLTNLVAFSG
jgi:uncharacterized protein